MNYLIGRPPFSMADCAAGKNLSLSLFKVAALAAIKCDSGHQGRRWFCAHPL